MKNEPRNQVTGLAGDIQTVLYSAADIQAMVQKLGSAICE